jgi:hypothetical protein
MMWAYSSNGRTLLTMPGTGMKSIRALEKGHAMSNLESR